MASAAAFDPETGSSSVQNVYVVPHQTYPTLLGKTSSGANRLRPKRPRPCGQVSFGLWDRRQRGGSRDDLENRVTIASGGSDGGGSSFRSSSGPLVQSGRAGARPAGSATASSGEPEPLAVSRLLAGVSREWLGPGWPSPSGHGQRGA